MRTQTSFGLAAHAAFGPLAAVVPMVIGSVVASGASALLGRALGPKSPKGGTAAQASAPQPPRAPQPFSQGGGFFGNNPGSMGGTFLTGRASSAPSLGGSSGKKTLLGA